MNAMVGSLVFSWVAKQACRPIFPSKRTEGGSSSATRDGKQNSQIICLISGGRQGKKLKSLLAILDDENGHSLASVK